jgi:hypothetical protein
LCFDTACLISALNAVQSKLHHLQSENSISRRRVRELELELETYKEDVAKDPTLRRDLSYLRQSEASPVRNGGDIGRDNSDGGTIDEKQGKEALSLLSLQS